MKINISEATTVQLDWLVANCEGIIGGDYTYKTPGGLVYCEGIIPEGIVDAPESAFDVCVNSLKYSSDWSKGGPIIEREIYSFSTSVDNGRKYAWHKDTKSTGAGDTFLEAAMRCYVDSKLGDEVEIPEELVYE